MSDPIEDLLTEVARRLELSSSSRRFLRELVTRTDAHQPEIDAILTRTLKRWKLDRVSYVDRAILRMACCEILHFQDVPSNVSINEAVEIAKSLGGDDSGQFVNGVLDAIAREHRAADPKPGESGEQP